ncbi:MAG: transcriptional repressor [Acidimicrobiia bacterium]|nr:transcriptional repressor [Acidimicrobiia bacterium]
MGLNGPADDEVAERLARLDQRYTRHRRALVKALTQAGRPLTIPEILRTNPGLSQSTAYRNITVLIDAGAARRVSGTDDHGRFELAEALAGHHHHLVCGRCGNVADLVPTPRLERALAEAARAAAEQDGFDVTEHRFDLVGTCSECR